VRGRFLFPPWPTSLGARLVPFDFGWRGSGPRARRASRVSRVSERIPRPAFIALNPVRSEFPFEGVPCSRPITHEEQNVLLFRHHPFFFPLSEYFRLLVQSGLWPPCRSLLLFQTRRRSTFMSTEDSAFPFSFDSEQHSPLYPFAVLDSPRRIFTRRCSRDPTRRRELHAFSSCEARCPRKFQSGGRFSITLC